MNLISAAPAWLLFIFGIALLAAAIEDMVRLRISNVTSLMVLAGAILAALVEGPSWSLWQNLAVFVIILILGTAVFSAGLLGGGDVKLFAAAGLWLDLRSALWFVAFVFLAGGAVAVLYLLSRPFRRGRASARNARIPYGVAIALGALALVLVDRGAFQPHQRALPPIRIDPHRA